MQKRTYPILHFLFVTGAVLLLFYAIFHFKYRIEYDKMAGDNIWQSASTIKYVNMWLEDGPSLLHFTNYENYDSIEFNTLDERSPFVSYPDNNTLIVYLPAKLLGRTEIDISFLKHFQMILFAIEAVLVSWLLLLILYENGYRHKAGLFLAPVAGAGLWCLFPVNAYYLSNVFFADQSVLIFVTAFLFLDYLLHTDGLSKTARRVFYVLHFLVIVGGMMTDYFFWLLAFFVAIFRFCNVWIREKKISAACLHFLHYAVPVAVSLLLFLWQLSYTSRWKTLLLYKLHFRTREYDDKSWIYGRLLENVTSGFTQEERSFFIYYLLLLFGTLVAAFLYLLRKKDLKKIFTNNCAALLLATYIAIAFQLFLLKNHSAVHEFSMMKVSFVFITSIFVMGFVWSKVVKTGGAISVGSKAVSPFSFFFVIAYVIVFLITGVPSSTSHYWVTRDNEQDYTLAHILREHTTYEDVCFSLTYEIPEMPPNDLTISHKRIYLINSISEIDGYFPHLRPEAKKLLVIEKHPWSALEEHPITIEIDYSIGTVRYEDDDYCILELHG
ncbi:MAG: hypothetical protein J5935_06610 [Lachnospiraceae bacterium]|nr:hypothetical protein [Lachnospiraceae bacterium]